jgi:hypothetical protein
MPTSFNDRISDPNFKQLLPDQWVWRYMALSKLESMLQSGSLYFCRLDQFAGDPHEGSVSPKHRDSLLSFMLADGVSNEKAGEANRDMETWRESFRRTVYVNCWSENESESDALWQLFSSKDDCVAVQAQYKSLVEVIRPQDDMYLGRVTYVDDTPFGPMHHAAMFKRTAFAHEREVRLLKLPDIESFIKGDRKPGPRGISVPVDLAGLIQRIIVSPYCTQCYFEEVVTTIEKYVPPLASRIQWSQMRAIPRF